MRHGVMPATLHVDVPSRASIGPAGGVGADRGSSYRPTVVRAGRECLTGISGTNAHVILGAGPGGPGRKYLEPQAIPMCAFAGAAVGAFGLLGEALTAQAVVCSEWI